MIGISRGNFPDLQKGSSNLSVNKKNLVALKILKLSLKLDDIFIEKSLCQNSIVIFEKIVANIICSTLESALFRNKLGRVDKNISVNSISYIVIQAIYCVIKKVFEFALSF